MKAGLKSRSLTRPHLRLEVLDGMRGLAILWVAWFHFWQLSWVDFGIFSFIPTVGYVGVELFFFISGFCLTLPYVRAQVEGRSPPALKEFWYKRAIKILPSYWLALGVIVLFFHTPFEGVKQWFPHFFQHLFFIHSWFYPPQVAINGVFWSLEVEVQFYLLFPLIMLVFKRWPLRTVALGIGFANIARGWLLSLPPASIGHAQNTLPPLIDLFLGGMLAAYFHVKPPRWLLSLKGRVTLGTSVFALGVFILICFWGFKVRYQPMQVWQLYARLPLVITFFVFTVFTLRAPIPWQNCVSNRFLVFLSTISYNFYLWHQFIAGEFFRVRIPLPRTEDPHGDTEWGWKYFFLTLIVSTGVAIFLTACIERPLLKYGVSGVFKKLSIRFKSIITRS